jgi:polysaccharide biosynthesis transport protein
LHNGSARSGQVIGVTSCQPGDGVSTVAIGLAACAAQLGGAPALLVDANLARPSMSRIFELRAEPGLFEVLMETMDPGNCIRPSKFEGLSLMTAGCWTSGVEPVYLPTALAALIARLRSEYTTIVFDLPAAEECSPTSVIGGALDGVLLVVEAERVEDETARRATLRLQQANVVVLGVVLNKRK